MDEAKEKKDEPLAPGAALTRREWLLSLGSAVVLSGFRGAPTEIAEQPNVSRAPLPPGLYEPSLDHLTHALASEGAFVPIPPGAETEYVRPRSGPFVLHAFAPPEFAMVRRLVEIILGDDLMTASEKPAAGAPMSIYDEVAEWVDLVVSTAPAVRELARNLPAEQRALAVAYFGSEEPVRQLETFEPERVCREGLAWLGEESQRRFAKAFLDADRTAQVELVKSISDQHDRSASEGRADKSGTPPIQPEGSKTSGVDSGKRLFNFLKAESIRGFYTSRAGLKELDYKGNSFYAQSPGCSLSVASQTKADSPE